MNGRDGMEKRLAELEAELAAGERLMTELDERRQRLRDSMLRIGGAVQVLRELLGRPPGEGAAAAPSPGGEGEQP
ncbi:MAG TPA: hypothetical protein VF173_06085 [Thermoanaerobaculia bacterium]|nr:hypothetical protein [Thermoanaerobaculia bacterium]